MRRAVIAGAMAVAAGAVPLCGTAEAQPREAAFRRINAADIRARIIGRDITDDVHWSEYYRRDGVLEITGMGRRRTGNWRIERDMLCLRRPEISDTFECFEVWVRGAEVNLRMDGGTPSQPAFIRSHRAS